VTLNEFLKEYPWEEKWTRLGKPLDFLWTFELKADLDRLWPRLADTSSFNRKLGLPEMRFKEVNGQLKGSSVNAGVRQEWDEVPWDWEYGRTLANARIYQRGFAHYVRARYLFEEVGPGIVRVHTYFGWIPRGIAYRILLSVGMSRMEADYRRVMQEIERDLQGPQRAPRAVAGNFPERLAKIVGELEALGLDAMLVRQMACHVQRADDDELTRIRARALAREWGRDWREVVAVMLHATRKGMLCLTWDAVCPHCRGVRVELDALGEVPTRGTCEACSIDFDLTGPESLEVTFHVHPSVRAVEKKLFCAAEPARKPHILICETLPPGEIRFIRARIGQGRYRARIQGRKAYGLIDVDAGADTDTIDWLESGRVEVRPTPAIVVENREDSYNTYVLEEATVDRDALRPADLFALQDFRDLFSQEAVASNVMLEVGTQAILFTDVVGSTRLYEQEGDSVAFAAMREHFSIAREVVRAHRGGIVKTIGDAVMAAFERPADALEAGLALQKRVTESGRLQLRCTCHVGPCLAVRLDSNIDYFGGTVNVAAKIQAVANAREVVISEAVAADSEVRRILETHTVEHFEFPLKWAQRSVRLHRLTV